MSLERGSEVCVYFRRRGRVSIQSDAVWLKLLTRSTTANKTICLSRSNKKWWQATQSWIRWQARAMPPLSSPQGAGNGELMQDFGMSAEGEQISASTSGNR